MQLKSRSVFCLILSISVAAMVLLTGCKGEDLSKFVPAKGKYDARILRDEWGVPHVFGKHDADAGYGLAYANCEDDWTNIEESILLTRGKLASVKGKEAAKFDYMAQLFRAYDFVNQKYEKELSSDVRAVIEGYADGVTHFAALNRDKMPHMELPVTGKDIVASCTLRAPFFYELHRELLRVFGMEDALLDDEGALAKLVNEARAIGSNSWAVAPKRSADGATRFAINSHMPWSGPLTWYEAQVHSEDGWNVLGATFPLGPMIFKGHNADKGWTHTINRPDLADTYTLEINPANKNQYKFDGEWRDFERGTARIKVKLLGPISWTFKQEMLWSIHGPAIRRPNGVFALRFAGYGEIRQFEQWFRMNKARNLDEFTQAMRVDGLVSLNTMYADKAGNLLYAYLAKFPKRAEGYDWKGILPGDTSKTLWTEYYTFEDVPKVINPVSGFMQSCNNSPYRTTDGDDNPKPESFAPAMGIETKMTNRSLRALETYGKDPSITPDEFYEYKYDKAYSTESYMAAFLEKLFKAELPNDELVRKAVDLLKKWDLKTDRGNKLAALGVLSGEPDRQWQKSEKTAEPDPVELVRKAAQFLMEKYGTLEVPWENVLRLKRGKVDLPLGGGPDCLRCIEYKKDADGKLVGDNGDCYFQMVQWDKDGNLTSEAIHQFGAASTDPDSPHYADQAPLFADQKMRPALLDESDIRAHLAREYRPGDFAGAWYKK